MSTVSTAVPLPTCAYCGAFQHPIGQCPRVRRIEYHENGTVKAVDLVAPEVGVTVKAEALALAAKLRMAVEALQAIAKSDYRGNIPHEVTMARVALRDLDGEG